MYTVTRDQIKEIVDLTIDFSHDAAHWGESIDIEVLWLKIDRDILKVKT